MNKSPPLFDTVTAFAGQKNESQNFHFVGAFGPGLPGGKYLTY